MTNVFTFSGRLGRDSEKRFTQSGTAVLSFAVPVKSGYGERAKTDWIDCTLFGKRADALESYLKKGTPVVVTGEASLNTFQKNDGTNGARISVNVSDVTMMGGKPAQSETYPDRTTEPPETSADLNDPIPF